MNKLKTIHGELCSNPDKNASLSLSIEIGMMYLINKLKNSDKQNAILYVYDNETALFRLEVSKETDDNNEVSYVFGISISFDINDYDSTDTLILNNKELDYINYYNNNVINIENDDIFVQDTRDFVIMTDIIRTLLLDEDVTFNTDAVNLIKKDNVISAALTQEVKQNLKTQLNNFKGEI